MKLFQRLTSAVQVAMGRKSAFTSADLLGMLSGTGFARSGALVGWVNALAVSTVFGCVKVVSEDIAKVDCQLELRNNRSYELAKGHPLYEILAWQANEWLTAFEFREMMIAWAMMTGNAVAFITRGINGQILELIPIPPPWVFIRRIPGQFTLRYTITFPNGMGSIECGSGDVLHLRGPSYDSFVGADVIRFARESIGLAMVGEEHQARIAEGSLQAPGYLTTSGSLTAAQIDEIQKFLKENKGGIKNAGDTAIFQNGLEYKEIGVTGQKAEILMTRSFQVEEICRFFRVFPQMIGYTDKAMTHASADSFFIAHVQHSLTPWARRWEQVCRRDLLSEQEKQQGFVIKLMLNDLMRGDPETRGNFYKNLGQMRAITPNEVRIAEGMNPLPFDYMDEPISPVNMMTGDGDNKDDEDNISTTPNPTSSNNDVNDPDDDDENGDENAGD